MDEHFVAFGRMLADVAALCQLASEAITTADNYGQHFAWCEAKTQGFDKACNCGFRSTLDALKAERERLEVRITP